MLPVQKSAKLVWIFRTIVACDKLAVKLAYASSLFSDDMNRLLSGPGRFSNLMSELEIVLNRLDTRSGLCTNILAAMRAAMGFETGL